MSSGRAGCDYRLGFPRRDLYLNGTVFLANIPREILRYELGGYPVLKKWLGYRQAKRRDNAALSLRGA
jgi:hypothetical protein